MLEAVGHPVAVNPDGALERHARRRGWPIVHFSQRTRAMIRRAAAGVAATALTAAGFAGGDALRLTRLSDDLLERSTPGCWHEHDAIYRYSITMNSSSIQGDPHAN